MEVEARAGESAFLRGWGDCSRWSLKLTESRHSGIGDIGAQGVEPGGARSAASPPSRRAASGGLDRRGPRPRRRPTASATPTATASRSTTRASARPPPEHLRPSLKNQPQKYTGRGCAIKRLDHVNVLAADVRANREFCVDTLGYRLYERIELDDGSEAGAWMSASDRGPRADLHAGRARRPRPPAPPRVLGRHARGVPARRRHLPRRRRSTSRPRRPSTRSPRASSSTARARRQPHRGHDRRLPRLRPGGAGRRVDRGGAREGPGVGRADDRELPHVRHAAGRLEPTGGAPSQRTSGGDGGHRTSRTRRWSPCGTCRRA